MRSLFLSSRTGIECAEAAGVLLLRSMQHCGAVHQRHIQPSLFFAFTSVLYSQTTMQVMLRQYVLPQFEPPQMLCQAAAAALSQRPSAGLLAAIAAAASDGQPMCSSLSPVAAARLGQLEGLRGSLLAEAFALVAASPGCAAFVDSGSSPGRVQH